MVFNVIAIMIEYELEKIGQSDIMRMITESFQQVGNFEALPMPSRRFLLPMVFDHPFILNVEERYMAMQRDKAVYVPDNVAYVQENNGLPSRSAVFNILRKTRFLVVTVGFMTGLPLLWPLDPLARLTSQKYNPTRLSTPPGTIGIGGGMFCIYPADQPGGYMMLAKSIPVWDMYALRPGFREDKPWLCEAFDVVEFYEVSLEEYTDIERQFEAGTYEIKVEETTFDIQAELAREHEASNLPNAVEFCTLQKAGEERMRLREEQLLAEWQLDQEKNRPAKAPLEYDTNPGIKISSPQVGKVWKVHVKPGDVIQKGRQAVVLEAMKMEIPVIAGEAHDGLVVKEVLVDEGSLVSPGTVLVLLDKPS